MKDYEKIEKRSTEIKKIFKKIDSELHKIDGDNAFLGLQILSKYSKNLIVAAEHDKIYSISLDDAIENNITDEDVIELSKLNWMIDQDSFACFI